MGRQKWRSFMGFFDKSEGVGSTNFGERVKKPDTSSLDFLLPNNPTAAMNDKYEDDIAYKTFSIPTYQTSHVTFSRDVTKSAEAELLNDDKKGLEVTELDVERVLEQQNTHDLYCPNCSSCITRRLILRNRTRTVLVTGSGWSHGAHSDDTYAQQPTLYEECHGGGRGADMFRCLSCFSSFTLTGNGLFRLFGRKNVEEKIEDEQAQPSVKKNWFASIFAWNNKPEMNIEQDEDTVINIDSQQNELSQSVQEITSSLLQSSTQTNIAGREKTEEYKIEVIKSIVYGGLAESITSLCVVSFAAGGGASTFNILALGMASLIGGLFIICHNLWELRCNLLEHSNTQISNHVTDQRDRYKVLLVRRQNFILHAIVIIISHIVFGLMPPVVYGFSFQKTDDKQLKLVVVAASSLLCITLLAIGRAYVCRSPKPYLKTVVTFVILGFMVSGISYAAGELVERLLEKLGMFETSSVSGLVLDEINLTGKGSAWASY